MNNNDLRWLLLYNSTVQELFKLGYKFMTDLYKNGESFDQILESFNKSDKKHDLAIYGINKESVVCKIYSWKEVNRLLKLEML